jgi:alkanesulfonate monooxygenase SsuD/methylene tetrahydromethanopterin reductase-like flavin-dependent oxidoreductase (luciferase family)
LATGIIILPQRQPAVLAKIVVGRRSRAAYSRAVRRAHGWYGYFITPEETADALAALRQVATEGQRPATLGELEISVTPGAGSTAPWSSGTPSSGFTGWSSCLPEASIWTGWPNSSASTPRAN